MYDILMLGAFDGGISVNIIFIVAILFAVVSSLINDFGFPKELINGAILLGVALGLVLGVLKLVGAVGLSLGLLQIVFWAGVTVLLWFSAPIHLGYFSSSYSKRMIHDIVQASLKGQKYMGTRWKGRDFTNLAFNTSGFIASYQRTRGVAPSESEIELAKKYHKRGLQRGRVRLFKGMYGFLLGGLFLMFLCSSLWMGESWDGGFNASIIWNSYIWQIVLGLFLTLRIYYMACDAVKSSLPLRYKLTFLLLPIVVVTVFNARDLSFATGVQQLPTSTEQAMRHVWRGVADGYVDASWITRTEEYTGDDAPLQYNVNDYLDGRRQLVAYWEAIDSTEFVDEVAAATAFARFIQCECFGEDNDATVQRGAKQLSLFRSFTNDDPDVMRAVIAPFAGTRCSRVIGGIRHTTNSVVDLKIVDDLFSRFGQTYHIY